MLNTSSNMLCTQKCNHNNENSGVKRRKFFFKVCIHMHLVLCFCYMRTTIKMNELIILDYKLMLPYHIYNYGYCCSFVVCMCVFFFYICGTCVWNSCCFSFIHSLAAFVAFTVIVVVVAFLFSLSVAVSLFNFIVVGIVCMISYWKQLRPFEQYEPIGTQLHAYSHSNQLNAPDLVEYVIDRMSSIIRLSNRTAL